MRKLCLTRLPEEEKVRLPVSPYRRDEEVETVLAAIKNGAAR